VAEQSIEPVGFVAFGAEGVVPTFMDKMYGYNPDYRPLWADDPSVLERP